MKPLNDTTIARLTSWLEQEDDFVFLESSRETEENHQPLIFRRPCRRLVCIPGDDAAGFLAGADSLRRQGYFLAGWLAYDFGYLLESRLHRFLPDRSSDSNKPLAMLASYNEPLVYNHKTPTVSCGLLAGTYRLMLLEQGRAVERVLSIDDVLAAEEVYVANSVRGLVRVQVTEE